MEDHSIRGYLHRKSPDELEIALSYCLLQENISEYEEPICIILELFEKIGYLERIPQWLLRKWEYYIVNKE